MRGRNARAVWTVAHPGAHTRLYCARIMSEPEACGPEVDELARLARLARPPAAFHFSTRQEMEKMEIKGHKWSGRFFPGRVHDGDDVAHDLREVEILRRVDACDSGLDQQLGVGRRDDAADHDRHVADAGPGEAVEHVAHQRDMAARQDRQADDMYALLERGVDDAVGRETDALVDHFHAAVAGAHGDLLGAVRMTVEAGLADQNLD